MSRSIKAALRILFLEDDQNDRLLLESKLEQDGLDCVITFASTRKEFEQALRRQEFDLILSDYNLPSYDGMAALATARDLSPETPFILVSGTIGEERAVESLKAGATDCVLKDRMARLPSVVRRALRETTERARRREAEEALRRQTEHLRALAARLQAGREEERIHISREIHDEFGEVLTGLKLGLTWIRQQLNRGDQPPPREPLLDKIDSLGSMVNGTAMRVRKLCTELRPSILDDLGLPAAIEWQAGEFEKRTGIRCQLVDHLHSLTVDDEQATAVFRIFQEILTNVARHADASRVRVLLKGTGPDLLLQVKDNGKGISEKAANNRVSLGILGMRERATLLGGNLVVKAEPGGGTRVTVRIPLEQAVLKTEAGRREESST